MIAKLFSGFTTSFLISNKIVSMFARIIYGPNSKKTLSNPAPIRGLLYILRTIAPTQVDGGAA